MARGAGRSHFSAPACVGLLVVLGCEPAADPPMSPLRPAGLRPPSASPPDAGAALDAGAEAAPRDAFPGELASIAEETSVYAEPRWGGKRIGYLRAGAIVRRGAAPLAAGPRCPQGWYAIEPRGYVCVGAMATLDTQHPVARASHKAPSMEGLPYLYALAKGAPIPLYARLPSRADQRRFEPDLSKHLAKAGLSPGLPPAEPVPDWLTPGSPSLHLGNTWHGPDRVLLGHPRGRAGFALLSTVEHEGRRFGITTGLAMIPMDRTRLVTESRFSGVVLGEGMTLPLAFARRQGVFRVIEDARGLTPGPLVGFREAVAITGEERQREGTKYLVAKDGSLIRDHDVVVVRAPKHTPKWAEDGQKWIDVSIPRQALVAYEGMTPVYATLVSTGVGGTANPEETHATAQGIFKVYEKHVTVTMDGNEASDAFDLRDVPFVQYFHKGYALHAAYWHDDFGHAHSHGCVNLAPIDAAWLFRFTDPRVPPGWHGTMAKEGTIVYVHD